MQYYCFFIIAANRPSDPGSMAEVLMDERKVFSVEIAGVPMEIRCKYAKNKAFFSDYFTDKAPLFSIEPQIEALDRIRRSFDRTAAAENRPNTDYPLWFLENNAIHELIAERIVAENVLLMHGSCIAMDGKAFLFTAPSGTGKSTHTRLWREVFGDRCFMVNDDKPMLRFENGIITACGTPWTGKHGLGSNTSVPLSAIIKLERAEENTIEPITKQDAFEVVFRQAYTSRNAETMRKILFLEQQLMDNVRFFSLGCNMDKEAAVIAWNGLNNETGSSNND